MREEEYLTGLDYLNRPLLEIMSHPDYSDEAMKIMAKIAKMNTSEIEKIIVMGGYN